MNGFCDSSYLNQKPPRKAVFAVSHTKPSETVGSAIYYFPELVCCFCFDVRNVLQALLFHVNQQGHLEMEDYAVALSQ